MVAIILFASIMYKFTSTALLLAITLPLFLIDMF